MKAKFDKTGFLDEFEKEVSNRFDYFRTDYGIYVLGDSSEVLKLIPDGSIDLIITDPPYAKLKSNTGKYDDDNTLFELEDELHRVLRNNAWFIVYWSVKNLPKIFHLKKFSYEWLIVFSFVNTLSKSKLGDRCWSPVVVFSKGKPKVVFRRSDIIASEELPFIQEKIKQPDFKPTSVQSRLIQMFMRKDEVVLDPFGGFGSLAKVCETFKRNWVCVEIDKERFEKAKDFILYDIVPKSSGINKETLRSRTLF